MFHPWLTIPAALAGLALLESFLLSCQSWEHRRFTRNRLRPRLNPDLGENTSLVNGVNDMYTPVMNYEHLSRVEVLALHAKCFTSYYFRWPYLFDNMHLLWPVLRKFGVGRRFRAATANAAKTQAGIPDRLRPVA
jgi:hypothetical protein